MERNEDIAVGQVTLRTTHSGREKLYQRIDHDIPDSVDFVGRNALVLEVGISILRRSEQEIGESVCHDAVDLFRHGSIERTKPSFYVSHLNEQFRAHQRRGDRRINVPINENQVWLCVKHDRLKSTHDLSRLVRMTARTDLKVYIGLWNVQLREENIRHISVIMLAGVDQGLLRPTVLERPQHRRRLHEVWSSAHDVQNVHEFVNPD